MPLSELTSRVLQFTSDLHRDVKHVTADTEPLMQQRCSEALSKYCDSVLLQEEIKCLASRESYGPRHKTANAFEDRDSNAVWRWEINRLSLLPTEDLTLVKEVKAWRSRYSRALKGIGKIVETLMKDRGTTADTKLSELEEKVSKAIADIEKAREKRSESERKRLVDAAEKQKKLALQEMQRKEKEAAASRRQQEKEEAQQRKSEEMRLKQAEAEKAAEEKAKKLEKQQNALKSFFKQPSVSSTMLPVHHGYGHGVSASSLSSSSSSAEMGCAATNDGAAASTSSDDVDVAIVGIVNGNSGASTSSVSMNSSPVEMSVDVSSLLNLNGIAVVSAYRKREILRAVKLPSQRPLDAEVFERDIGSNKSMSEISRTYRERCVLLTVQYDDTLDLCLS